MITKLLTSNAYVSLCKDLYSLGIFDQALNGLLTVVEKTDKDQTILIERKFFDDSRNLIGSGYYFIRCLNSICEKKQLKEFRGLLENIVNKKGNGNYMEVDPILIAPAYTEPVASFVQQYNRIQRRKPIQLFMCGE